MKSITLLLVALCFISSANAVECSKDFPGQVHDFDVLRSSNDKTFLMKNWDKMPVIKVFDKGYCESLIDMDLVKVKNRFFWVFRSIDDACDGGNTHGVIYNYSLTKPVAEISDGDIGCL